MLVNVNLKSKHGGSVDCHYERCWEGGMIRPKEPMFALSKNTSEPPYDEMETVWFHPKCFLVWCMMAVSNKRELGRTHEELLEWLQAGEKLIHV